MKNNNCPLGKVGSQLIDPLSDNVDLLVSESYAEKCYLTKIVESAYFSFETFMLHRGSASLH